MLGHATHAKCSVTWKWVTCTYDKPATQLILYHRLFWMCNRDKTNQSLELKTLWSAVRSGRKRQQAAEPSAAAPLWSRALSPFRCRSASGQSGDLRLGVASSGGQHVFAALCQEAQKAGELIKQGDVSSMNMIQGVEEQSWAQNSGCSLWLFQTKKLRNTQSLVCYFVFPVP